MAAVPLNDLPNAVPEHDLPIELQSAQHPNMHYELGDWVKNAPAKSPTGSNITETLGNLWEASKFEGLTPEVNPIGGLTRLPSAEKGKVAVQGLVNAAKNSTVAQKLGDLLSSAGNAVGSIPKRVLAFESSKDPLAFSTLYNAAKEGNKEALAAVKEATPLGELLHKDAIYNYTRNMFNAPHEIAMKAEDFTRGKNERGLGAWDVGADARYLENPDMPAALARQQNPAYKPWNELSDAEKIKQATQAGVDTSTWSVLPPKSIQGIGIGDVAKLIGKKALLPLAPLASPRISRMAAILAGQGANVAGKVGDVAGSAVNMLPEASLEDLINAGLLDARTMRAKQGEQ